MKGIDFISRSLFTSSSSETEKDKLQGKLQLSKQTRAIEFLQSVKGKALQHPWMTASCITAAIALSYKLGAKDAIHDYFYPKPKHWSPLPMWSSYVAIAALAITLFGGGIKRMCVGTRNTVTTQPPQAQSNSQARPEPLSNLPFMALTNLTPSQFIRNRLQNRGFALVSRSCIKTPPELQPAYEHLKNSFNTVATDELNKFILGVDCIIKGNAIAVVSEKPTDRLIATMFDSLDLDINEFLIKLIVKSLSQLPDYQKGQDRACTIVMRKVPLDSNHEQASYEHYPEKNRYIVVYNIERNNIVGGELILGDQVSARLDQPLDCCFIDTDKTTYQVRDYALAENCDQGYIDTLELHFSPKELAIS